MIAWLITFSLLCFEKGKELIKKGYVFAYGGQVFGGDAELFGVVGDESLLGVWLSEHLDEVLEVLLALGELVGGDVVDVVENVLNVVEEGFEEHLDDFVLYLGGELRIQTAWIMFQVRIQ